VLCHYLGTDPFGFVPGATTVVPARSQNFWRSSCANKQTFFLDESPHPPHHEKANPLRFSDGRSVQSTIFANSRGLQFQSAHHRMPAKYIIFAGPQGAGKSTLIRHLCNRDLKITPLQESRQVIVHKYLRDGAIFMTELDEIEVIHHDMTRMFTIRGQNSRNRVYIDETNVFTLAHARAHGIDLVAGYYRQYCDILKTLNAAIVFVDASAEVSWTRRRHRYAQRLWDLAEEERLHFMARYEAYLVKLRPELLALYDGLDLPKVKIGGNSSLKECCQASEEAFRQFCSQC